MPKSNQNINSTQSIAEKVKNVDIKGWIKKDTHEDPRINSLLRIIRWQGRFIVMLVFGLIIAVALPMLDLELTIPNQEALKTAPPITIGDVDYIAITYQENRQITHEQTVNKPEITLVGQIYDGKRVFNQWPNLQFLINNSIVPIAGDNSQFNYKFQLHPGSNVIETAFRINGVLYNRRQKVINYEPTAKTVTNTNETVSTQATVPSGR